MTKLLKRIFKAFREDTGASVTPSTWNDQVWTPTMAKVWSTFLATETGMALLERLRHLEAENNERACSPVGYNREFVSGAAFGRKCVREDLLAMQVVAEEDEPEPTLSDEDVEKRVKARVNFYRGSNFNEEPNFI